MYYLTVNKNGEEIISRQMFFDFGQAIGHAAQWYKPRLDGSRCTLDFHTDVINGELARAYAHLNRPETIRNELPFSERRYETAVKQEIAFLYDADYVFLIETEAGVKDAMLFEK